MLNELDYTAWCEETKAWSPEQFEDYFRNEKRRNLRMIKAAYRVWENTWNLIISTIGHTITVDNALLSGIRWLYNHLDIKLLKNGGGSAW